MVTETKPNKTRQTRWVSSSSSSQENHGTEYPPRPGAHSPYLISGPRWRLPLRGLRVTGRVRSRTGPEGRDSRYTYLCTGCTWDSPLVSLCFKLSLFASQSTTVTFIQKKRKNVPDSCPKSVPTDTGRHTLPPRHRSRSFRPQDRRNTFSSDRGPTSFYLIM